MVGKGAGLSNKGVYKCTTVGGKKVRNEFPVEPTEGTDRII